MTNYTDFIGDSTKDLNTRTSSVESANTTQNSQIAAINANISTLTENVSELLATPSRTVIGKNDIGVDYQSSTIQVSKVAVAELPKKNGQCENTYHTMMVKLSSGVLVGWGDNTPGLLANGHTDGDNLPQQVLFDPFEPPAMASPTNAVISDWTITGGSSYVVFSDGTAYSAGFTTVGQSGHGIANTTPITYFRKLQYFIKYDTGTAARSGATVTGTGTSFVTAGVSAGDLIGWGTDPHSITTWYTIASVVNATTLTISNPPGGTQVAAAYVIIPATNPTLERVWAVGDKQSVGQGGAVFFSDSNNRLWACGENVVGNLGIGNNVDQPTPVLVTQTNGSPWGDGEIEELYFTSQNGQYSTYVLCTNGHLWTCGLNSTYQLGDGTNVNKNRLTHVTPGTVATAITITGTVAVAGTAVTGTGTAFQAANVTGGNTMQIGFGSRNPASISTWYNISTVNSDSSLTLASGAGTIGAGSAFVIRAVSGAQSGARVIEQMSVTGGYNSGTGVRGTSVILLDSIGDVWTVGYNVSGQCGVGSTTTVQSWVRVLQNCQSVGNGNGNKAVSWAIEKVTGELIAWGDNGTGALFTGTLVDKTTPSKVSDLSNNKFKPLFVLPAVGDANTLEQAMLLVYTDDGVLHAAGNLHSLYGVLDPAFTNYCYRIPLPSSFLSEAESIADMVWRGNSTTNSRLHILSSVGNLYSSGDQANGAVSGGYATTSVPTAYQWLKIDFPIGIQTPQSVGTGNSQPDPVTPLHGGTGVNILPEGGLIIGHDLDPVSVLLPGSPGQQAVSNGLSWVAGGGPTRRVMDLFPRIQGSAAINLAVNGFDSAGLAQSGVSAFNASSVVSGFLVINPVTATTAKIYDYSSYTNPVLLKPIWDFIFAYGPSNPNTGLYWAALAAGDISALTAPTSTIGVYCNGPSTATYTAYVHDGTDAEEYDTGIDTGESVAHRFRFDMSDGESAKFYIDGDLVHTFENIPNAYLGYHFSAKQNSGNVSMLIGMTRLETY